MNEPNKSEVARLRKQIELEYQAAQRVLTGFTPTGRHAFITKRQEHIEACYQELKQYISPEEAMKIMIQAEDAASGKGEGYVPLENYLKENNIDPVRLSIAAGVRYSTVWNAMKGHPIKQEQAQKICAALYRITGSVYTGTLVTLQEQQRDEPPTLPIRKFPKIR